MKNRGFEAPWLVVGDGTLGFRAALAKVFAVFVNIVVA